MARQPAPARYRAKIRMYRHGLGDCLLVTLPRTGSERDTYTILIDCGVIQGTPDAQAVMTEVVDDIVAETKGTVDLLLATHEHWDHLSGFIQASASFRKLTVDQVWLAWTENPDDPAARSLASGRDQALATLRASQVYLQMAGSAAAAAELGEVLSFFGAAGPGGSTRDALEKVRSMGGAPVRYCDPTDGPTRPDGVAANLYVLGPPRDPMFLRKTSPSKSNPETYDMAREPWDGFRFLADTVAPGLDGTAEGPFGSMWQIPVSRARELPFFQAHYWNDDPGADDSWRRVDTAWLDGAGDLALQLDSMTNNTSLVLAIELDGAEVLLFAADAQVGNWLSWQTLKWDVDGRSVTGQDLLGRTSLYKVGHHGSHNATLRDKGLELMSNLEAAMLPVNKAMAMKKGWTRMPLPSLVQAIADKTEGRLMQSDQNLPRALAGRATGTALYFEYVL